MSTRPLSDERLVECIAYWGGWDGSRGSVQDDTRRALLELQHRRTVRPDAEVLQKVPELQGTRALVCYFATDKDRDDFAAMLVQALPNARTVNLE